MGSSSSKVAQTASKVASSTAPKAARKYPTRSPPPATTQRSEAPRIERDAFAAPAPPTEFTNEGTQPSQPSQPDLLNKALNDRLRQLGPITPNPTYSNTSTFNQTHPSPPPTNPNADPTTTAQSFQPSPTNPSQTIYPSKSANPAISLLTARYRLAEEAEKEFAMTGRSGDKGRSFIDVVTLRQMLVLREQGVTETEIEGRLGIQPGVMGRLGGKGVVGVAR